MQKKAQTATEYLIILAVVIIIALVVIGVLGGIPGIGSGMRATADSTYWRTANIGITSIVANVDGNVNITLRNNFPDSIRIQNVTLTDGSNPVKYDNTSRILPISGSSVWSISDMPTGTAGESFSYIVKITYVDIRTGAQYEFPAGTERSIGGVYTS
jgi:hypothetical protein